jgi:hypothetical protein
LIDTAKEEAAAKEIAQAQRDLLARQLEEVDGKARQIEARADSERSEYTVHAREMAEQYSGLVTRSLTMYDETHKRLDAAEKAIADMRVALLPEPRGLLSAPESVDDVEARIDRASTIAHDYSASLSGVAGMINMISKISSSWAVGGQQVIAAQSVMRHGSDRNTEEPPST